MYLGETERIHMAFLLARDVPIPSPGSSDELEATWKLIRWRNSISRAVTWLGEELHDDNTWPEIFSDISRYSPEFLESCLCHFRTWTKALKDGKNGDFHYGITFDSIVEQALHRDLTTREALALVRAFCGYLASYERSWSAEDVDKTDIIQQPHMYAMAVLDLTESIRAIHLGMTRLIARAAEPWIRRGHPQWMRWVTLMLWITIPKKGVDFNSFPYNYDEVTDSDDEMPNKDRMISTNRVLQGPHLAEIERILWPMDNDDRISMSKDAFKSRQRLVSDVLLSLVPLTPLPPEVFGAPASMDFLYPPSPPELGTYTALPLSSCGIWIGGPGNICVFLYRTDSPRA
jgi:hypothetical protein